MPGLVNWTTSTVLPLAASEVTSCVSGYAFGMTACLSYRNSENHPFEGLFVYPLDEYTTVVGFEAVISERVVTVQIKDKARIEESCFSNGRPPDEEGHVVLDEDLERIVFVASVGIVPPQVDVSICISTSSELQTLPTGAVRVLLPDVCAPRVPQKASDLTSSLSGHHLPLDRHCSGTLSPEQAGKFCLAHLLEAETTNPAEYEFSFSLEIRGPCLLAGVESPTHEIRADADPSARSARSITITLANKHTFDRPVEVLIHPSEPHMPHVLMEEGDMAPAQYEQHLRGRSDFIKGTKKDPSPEKKTEIIRKRLHKDIPHHPVIMLNFCPDLKTVQPNLRMTHGEFIFLVDRSRSMAGTNIARVKDALVVILKSLVPGCLFNIIGFGSTFKAVFPASQVYSEENLAGACESIKKIRADMGSTNILSPLKWVIRQPIHRGHPRLLFLLTEGVGGNTGKVLELLRSHASSTRCYTFGIGKNACRRLLKGLAAVAKGSAEFLAEGERVQPKMIRSLKKAMAPVVSDVSVDWVFPETTEALISPVNASCLFPGDRLVAYSIVCDTSLYVSNPRLDKRRRYRMLHSQESGSSVFFHSQEEGGGGGGGGGGGLENWEITKDPESGFPSERSSGEMGSESDVDSGIDPITTSQRRAYSTNQIADQEPPQKVPTASDSGFVQESNPLRKVHLQDLSWIASDAQPWQVELQPLRASPTPTAKKIRGAGARRPSLLQDLRQMHRGPTQTVAGTGSGSQDTSSLLGYTYSDGRSPGEQESAQHPSFNFETESTSDWDLPDLEPGSSAGGGWRGSRRSLCKALVKGLQNGEPVKWEITFDLGPLFQSREDKGQEEEEEEEEDIWNETFHHLAAKSIVQDFEQLAEREFEIEHGSGRRYQANAVHTSKSCNVISKFTAFVPVDLSSNNYLTTIVKYPNTGVLMKPSSQRSSGFEGRRHRGLSASWGRIHDSADGGLPNANAEENILSPSGSLSSSGGNRQSFPDGSLRSPSVSSQKSIENFFGARLTFNKTRLLTKAARGFMGKFPAKSNELSSENENENVDYLPLVSLQLACGAFLLNKAFSEAINIPLEKLRWTSPFACHRMDLSPSTSSRKVEDPGQAKSASVADVPGKLLHQEAEEEETALHGHPSGGPAESSSRVPKAETSLSPPSITIQSFSTPENAPSPPDSGRGSETETSELQAWLFDVELQQRTEPEGMLWATAVALAWLEHSSASYFIEWELVAAKASRWLGEQDIPEGRNLPALKTAAQQLFVLLRHWNENLQFNLLCYNPKDV
ncbi:von Willebrand factor A domain-containing protein 5B1 isoform X2 [Pantherophis guttatus]|uniref:von Willebrand factor A domain-containing protein 5B1 isoform X2 n=1 Tax=Pantherophis guttatus TaxID=94885 RepID=A0A6P9C9Q5_PANGU|nr:von Willebrand factor A domain-containing protein 5B1 isoform X2 [Pantherophis guttatus]